MIEDCPECGYSLIGLPNQHCCPECGLEYESDAALFTEPRMAWKVLAIAYAALMVIGVIMYAWRPKGALGVWFPLGFGGISAVWIWHLQRRKHVILVSPRTIRILGRTEKQEIYRVSEVGRIKWSFVTGDVQIERRDGSELTTIKRRFLGSNVRALRIVRMVREYAESK